MANFTATPTQDTFLFSQVPGGNNGSQVALIIGTYRPVAATGFARGLIRIPLSAVPQGAVFLELTLTLKVASSVLDSDPITIHANRLLQPAWTELATWNTYDGTNNWPTSGAGVSFTTDNADSAVIADTNSDLVLSNLAAMANDALAVGLSNLDLRLHGPETVDGVNNYFQGHSREAVDVEDRPVASGVWDYVSDDSALSWVAKDEPLHWRATDEPLHWVGR